MYPHRTSNSSLKRIEILSRLNGFPDKPKLDIVSLKTRFKQYVSQNPIQDRVGGVKLTYFYVYNSVESPRRGLSVK